MRFFHQKFTEKPPVLEQHTPWFSPQKARTHRWGYKHYSGTLVLHVLLEGQVMKKQQSFITINSSII